MGREGDSVGGLRETERVEMFPIVGAVLPNNDSGPVRVLC